MYRADAFEELCLRIQSEKLIKHSLAVEAIMREIAEFSNEDVELWGLAGLLHNIDYERTMEEPSRRGMLAAEILENLGVDSTIVYAIKAHNNYNGIERRRKLDKALYSACGLAELILSTILALPSIKLKNITAEVILDKIEKNDFEKEEVLDKIKACEELNISLKQFIELSLKALIKISKKLC